MTQPQSIRDFVEVQKQPAVVRLDHLDGAEAGWISECFYVSPVIHDYLDCLKKHLLNGHGAGYFLIGHFGSGKSHFLAYLTQAVQRGDMGKKGMRVFPLSLINYRAFETLESIVQTAFGLDSGQITGDRRLIWETLLNGCPGGCVLILDELSEFLRSKASPQEFNEDIRFLQFLGEWAQNHPLWIIGAMQEKIEHTGTIDGDLFRKIKDRYPNRFVLKTTHVKDLLGQRILRKKEGFAAAITPLLDKLKKAFPDAGVDFPGIVQFYPLHPATIELLEEVRDRFSESRGIVEFTLARLLGDDARGIAAFLDRPFGEILTPDAITEHFRDIFDLQPEFYPISRQVLPAFEKDLERLFDNPNRRALARKLMRLLIVIHLSPNRESLSVNEASGMLLEKISVFDPDKNREVVADILDALATHGSHIKKAGDRYHIDVADNSGENLDKLLEQVTREISAKGETVFESLVGIVNGAPFNPFELRRDVWQGRNLDWNFHSRKILVYFGGGESLKETLQDEVSLHIGLPWGAPPVAGAHFRVCPKPLRASREIIELAALVEIAERPLSREFLDRVFERIAERRETLWREIKLAYDSADLCAPMGEPEKLASLSAANSFDDYLKMIGKHLLRKTYPKFESFAPMLGPLPKQAFRELMDFLSTGDLSQPDLPENVQQLVEGYLVPLKLVRRTGRTYEIIPYLERHELVARLAQILPHEPGVQRVYALFSAPIYGLVPEQIHLLLLLLLIKGEIDIRKGDKSYRDIYTEMPLPILYDKITAGKGLSPSHLKMLDRLVTALGIRVPSQWTVLSQRQAGKRLAEFAITERDALGKFQTKIVADSDEESRSADALVLKINALMGSWHIFDGKDEIDDLAQFFYEIESIESFLSLHDDLKMLRQKFDALSGERAKFAHLLAAPPVKTWLAGTAGKPGFSPEPPSLADPTAVEGWIAKARVVYADYTRQYRDAHQAYWAGINALPVWTFRVPELARSRHLGLASELTLLKDLRDKAQSQKCLGLTSLDFNPLCQCGFNGESSAMSAVIGNIQELTTRIETELKHFCARNDVKEKMQSWLDVDLKDRVAIGRYLKGESSYPQFTGDPSLLDKHLGGLETHQVKHIETAFAFLAGRVWEKRELIETLNRQLQNLPDRIRFVAAVNPAESTRADDALFTWSIAQATRHGEPLPRELVTPLLQKAVVDKIEPAWVGTDCLKNLGKLNLGLPAEDKILKFVFDGKVAMMRDGTMSEAVEMVLALAQTQTQTTHSLAQYRELTGKICRYHARFFRLFGKAWIDYVNALAKANLTDMPHDLYEVIAGETAREWLVIDSLGLPLLDDAEQTIAETLKPWRIGGVAFGLAGEHTTTESFWSKLSHAGLQKPIRKINVIDRLVHERNDFDELVEVAKAELKIGLKREAKNLDPGKPLLIFADHGFRIASAGRGFSHGSNTTLERLVPVLRLEPRLPA